MCRVMMSENYSYCVSVCAVLLLVYSGGERERLTALPKSTEHVALTLGMSR